VSEIGNPSVVVQRLAGCPTGEAELVGVTGDEDNRGNQAARSAVAFESLSYLKLDEIYSMKGATAAEVEVVGTCVYYYLSEAGHDARSRIGRITVFLCSVRRLFLRLGAPGRRAVSDSTSGMWALPRVWRRKRFIVQRPLVGGPVRIWIANSQIAVRMLQFSYVDVRRRRSDDLRQRHPGSEEQRGRGLARNTLLSWQASRQRSRVAGSEHKIGQESDKCSYGHCAMRGSGSLADRL